MRCPLCVGVYMGSVIRMAQPTAAGDLPAHARYSPHLQSSLPELNAFADLAAMVAEANLSYLSSLVHCARSDAEHVLSYLPQSSDTDDVQWLAQLTPQDVKWFAQQPAPYFILSTTQIRSNASSMLTIEQLLDEVPESVAAPKKAARAVVNEGIMAANHAWLNAVTLGSRLCPQQVRALIPNLESTTEVEFLCRLTHSQIYQLSRCCKPTMTVRLSTMKKALSRNDSLYTMMGLLREARGPSRSKK